MKKFKIIISICIILAILSGGVFSVFYFWRKDSDAKIVTTIFPIYDICREVLGDSDDIMLLNDSGADLHGYQPSIHDIISISNAELFLYIGGESDRWVDDLLHSSGNNNIKSMALVDYVEKLSEPLHSILDGDHSHNHKEKIENHHEHNHGEFDEHIWLSIRNMIVLTEVVTEELKCIYPDRETQILENSNAYISKLKSLEYDYFNSLNNSLQTIIVADRFPLIYLFNDYNLNYVAAFSGCSSDTEASAETLVHLIEEVNHHNADYLLVLESSDKKVANRIINNDFCKEGIEILVFDSCQTVNIRQLENTSYIDIMNNNLTILKKAVSQ